MDKFFNNNTAMKGIAFLIALMLWMIVTLDQQESSSFRPVEEQLVLDEVKVEAVYDEERYTVVEMDDKVQVILTGRRALLNIVNLRQDVYRLYVDLTELGPGMHRMPVQHEGFPQELVVTLVPSQVLVVLEENQSRLFPVEISYSGQLPEGYQRGEAQLNPAQVEVRGPASLLDQVEAVRGRVNLARLDRNGSTTVRLKAYNHAGEELDVEIQPETASVTIPLQTPTAHLPVQIRTINQLPDRLRLINLTPEPGTVEVSAPRSLLDQLDEIEVTVDLSLVEKSTTVPVEIERDERWIHVRPERIRVRVEVEDVSEESDSPDEAESTMADVEDQPEEVQEGE